jgi:hypothetical protein
LVMIAPALSASGIRALWSNTSRTCPGTLGKSYLCVLQYDRCRAGGGRRRSQEWTDVTDHCDRRPERTDIYRY